MNKDEKPIAEKIRSGLSHCLPVTEEEGELTCETCPYQADCENSKNEVTSVRLPITMIKDIRLLVSGVLMR